MEDEIRVKANELRRALHSLGKRLEAGDDCELLVWVIPGVLACAHRPLRHHPQFGGSARDLPPEAASAVVNWAHRIKGYGIRAIISLMHPKELRHYAQLDLGGPNLIELYRKEGFEVRHIPWEDPAHRSTASQASFAHELSRVRAEALKAFDALPNRSYCTVAQESIARPPSPPSFSLRGRRILVPMSTDEFKAPARFIGLGLTSGWSRRRFAGARGAAQPHPVRHKKIMRTKVDN